MRGRVILALAAFAFVAATLPAAPQPLDVEITDIAPTHVEYPKGPTVIVRNRSRQAGFEAWVIRHLDGVVVKRYALPAAERWEEQLEIAPKGIRLPGQVKDTLTTVPFVVVVLSANGQVRASAPFDARVSPAKSKWPTFWGDAPKQAPLLASGEVVDMKKTGLTIKDSAGAQKTYRLADDTMSWGGAGRVAQSTPSKGDSVSLIYSDQPGYDVALKIAYRPAGAPSNPWVPGSAYIGTIKSVVTRSGDALVVETTKYDGQWLVDTSTEKVLSPGVPTLKQLTPGTLVGLRVKDGAPAQAPIPADRVFVLTAAQPGG